MKALVLGAKGQLGRALGTVAPAGVDAVHLDRAALDITDAAAIGMCVDEHAPDLIINAAAYTAVDAAEGDEATAYRVNALAVGLIADAARRAGSRFVHISTDFVFDGAAGHPYAPNARPHPLGAYGRTKFAGEKLAGPDALVVRTAWVYGTAGGNFVRTMLRLMASKPEVRVVADQIGTPTYAPSLATALWALGRSDAKGIHHYTDSGVASWYDYAVAIQEEALARGLLTRAVPIVPIASDAFPTPARRPSYSVLDTRETIARLGAPAPHWRVNLRIMLDQVGAHG